MLRATANQLLPTTITGSLPRPSWYTENLGLKSFLEALVETRFREQYEDALAVYFNEQLIAGLDIVTDGDARFTQDIGGQSWTSYPPFHMAGFDGIPKMAPVGGGGIGFPRGHILHDYIEARLMPSIVGPVGRGQMQYAQMYKAAQRMTDKPVKFGTVTPELVAFAVQDFYYKDVRERIWALSDAFNEELHALADAGCPSSRWKSRRSTCWRRAASSTRSSTPSTCSRCSTTPCVGCAPRPRSGATRAGATRRSSACSRKCRATSRR